jgi:hypothetical protein
MLKLMQMKTIISWLSPLFSSSAIEEKGKATAAPD